jgi:signal transduction histidine kinase
MVENILNSQVVTTWIPENFSEFGDEDRIRAQFFVFCVPGAAVVATPFGFLLPAIFDMPLAGSVVAGIVLLNLTSLVVLYQTGRLKWASRTSSLLIFVGTFYLAAITGGIISPAVVWFALSPVFALLFANLEESIGWTAVVLLGMSVLYLADGASSVEMIVDQKYRLRTLFSFSGLTLLMVLMFVGHSRFVRRIEVERLDEARKREATARSEAEKASDAKTRFLGNISHEIRNPLNGIIGMLELLKGTDLSEGQRDYVETASRSARSLSQLVHDVLDISKMEADSIGLEPKVFDLRKLAGETLASLAPEVFEKDIELLLWVDSRLPRRLRGDPGKIKQILTNLVTNAIKFTDEGEIVVEIDCSAAHWSVSEVQISVSDTGSGIPKEDWELIFDSFRQSENTEEYKSEGVGLGLAISRELVELMQGDMWIESTVGEGTTFYFTMMLGTVKSPLAETDVPEQLAQKRVLLVDKNEASRRVLAEHTEQLRMVWRDAEAGDEALECLARDDLAFDLVIADVASIETEIDEFLMDLEAIRSNQKPPVILLNRPGQIVDVHSPKIEVHWLGKPVQPLSFRQTIEELFVDGATFGENLDADEVEPELTALQVLVVDDSAVNRRVAKGLLERESHSVTVAETGEQGLQKALNRDFDLVLMDLRMPDISGLNASRRIRERKSKRQLPIIALTGQVFEDVKEDCLDAGMNDFLPKPIEPIQLYDAVARVASSTKKSNQSDCVAAESNVVDADRALKHLDGDVEMFRELAEIFVEDESEYRRQLREAVENEKTAVITRISHTLKTELEILGASIFSGIAERIESLTGNGHLEECLPLVRKLEEGLKETAESLRQRL